MAYQLVNLTTCKSFNRQFRQRVESVKARAHNAPLRVITPLVLRVSASPPRRRGGGAWTQKKLLP